ncbi:substrate-binding domain-containing protein [Methyloligella sp. 2.7D]|uniref:PstS family phosphate ABC transporter substrate-binding protein n=1 Tax=unclassified Methyloligella TaxID=2625955 RepID=UPI00157D8412|nr:substrate-binding domain-containing protein [Methyloligella sp. GL2]QKP78511.1 substrate-binding domain-containing protein [Methyloligella sp. GL2]
MKKISIAAASLAVAALCTAGPALARDQIQIAGSSTVLPYAQIVAEDFGKSYSKYPTPVVESGGSSAGLKQFCQGLGENTIDIADASRPIKDKEIKACSEAGVKNIMQVRFGYDGIVFASTADGPDLALEPKDLYLALAEQVPVDGKMVKNPNKTWKDVNADLPDWKIAAYIPGEKHGTREVFEEKVLAKGCEASGGMKALEESGMDEDAVEDACIKVRKDGAAVDIDGDYTETLARLQSNPEGIGVFGLSFYENNTDKLKVATMSGVTPSVPTIASGEYPVSRPLFFYVKKDHMDVIPGLKEYVEYFVSDKMIGPDGPLAEYGLVPLPEDEAEALREEVKEGKILSM